MNMPNDPTPAGLGAGTRAPGAPSHASTSQDASVGSLLKQLAQEIPALFGKELALAKSEVRESMQATKAGVAAVAMGGAVALGGFLILLLAAVYGLSNVVEPWLAALIVGGITLLIGLGMVSAGKKKFEVQSFTPDRTLDAMRKDKNAVQERTP